MSFIEDKRYIQYNARCLFFDRENDVSELSSDTLNVSFHAGDDHNSVNKDIKLIMKILGASKIAILHQIHSKKIVKLEDGMNIEADGIYTNKRGIFCGVKFADCMPIVIFDTGEHYGCSVHAGWRGSFLKIAKEAVKALKDLGSNPKHMIVTLGPHICEDCYEIKEDVANKFDSSFINERNNKLFLSLARVNIRQLLDENIATNAILNLNICTYESSNFFSYRRDKITKRNIGGFIIK